MRHQHDVGVFELKAAGQKLCRQKEQNVLIVVVVFPADNSEKQEV